MALCGVIIGLFFRGTFSFFHSSFFGLVLVGFVSFILTMNKLQYKEYLNSEHWVNFRKEVYSKRKRCQKCCSKVKLNIHHITYDNLGKETHDDVLVLCNVCHFKGHKKPKFIKRMREGGLLDFVRTAKKQDTKFYKPSEVFRTCDRCAKSHAVFYKVFKNGKLTLAMACPTSKPRTAFLKFEAGLDIPILSRGNSK
jgi:hypothetical protein